MTAKQRRNVTIDAIVATPQQVERHRDSIGLIYDPAVQGGKVFYDRMAAS